MTRNGLKNSNIAAFRLVNLFQSQFSLLVLEVRAQRAEFLQQNKQIALILALSLGYMLVVAPALFAHLFGNLGHINLQNVVAALICAGIFSASDMVFDSFVRTSLTKTHIKSLPIGRLYSILIFWAVHIRLQIFLYTLVGIGLIWSLMTENNLNSSFSKIITFVIFLINNVLCNYCYSARRVAFSLRVLITVASQAVIFLHLWYLVIIQICLLVALLSNRIRVMPTMRLGRLENTFIFDTWVGLSLSASLLYIILVQTLDPISAHIPSMELLSFIILWLLGKGLEQLTILFRNFGKAIAYMPYASRNLFKKSSFAFLLLFICFTLIICVTYFENKNNFYLIASILFGLSGMASGLHRVCSFIAQLLIVLIFFMAKFS